MKYFLKELLGDDQSLWDDFESDALESSIFHQRSFFASFSKNFRLFLVLLGTQVKAGVLCFVDENDPRRMKAAPGVIHDGILFKKNFVDSSSPSKINSRKFEIIETVVKSLNDYFDNVSLTLLPSISDMRPFLWHNYHSNDTDDKYQVIPRYTSFLDITSFKDFKTVDNKNPFFQNLSSSRRQEIKYALKSNVEFECSENYDDFFIQYYELSKNYDKSANEFVEVLKELHINNAKSLKLFYIKNERGERVASALFGLKGDVAWYLYGVTSKENRERYSGSFIIWKALEYLSENYGIRIVDLEGVNSPQRGWFKLSFGGSLETYYKVRLN